MPRSNRRAPSPPFAWLGLVSSIVVGGLGCVVAPPSPSEPPPDPCPEPTHDTFVKVDGGRFTLTLPDSLGGLVIEGDQAPFGAYRRSFRGDELTVHDTWLSLPPVALPVPGLDSTGPLVIRQAVGGFDPEHVEALGEPNVGRFDPATGVLTETLGLVVDGPGLDPDNGTRVLLRKTEEGYDPELGASLSFTAEGVITDGPLAGATLQVVSHSGKGADYEFEVCKETRISTGHATVARGCTVSPSSLATCRVSNLQIAGGVLVHCQEPGLGSVTIEYIDGRGTQRVTRTLRCT